MSRWTRRRRPRLAQPQLREGVSKLFCPPPVWISLLRCPDFRVEFRFGGETSVEDFGLSSFQACVNTVAGSMSADGVVPASAISKPAYLAQCDLLEAAGVIAYPYAFYGVYPASRRADCARILQGVHSGKLPLPGPPPTG